MNFLNKFISFKTMCKMGCSSSVGRSVGRSVGIRGLWMASDAMVAYINDCVFMAILRDTNSLWWRLTRQFLPWAFSVARLSHCAMGSKPYWDCKNGRLWRSFLSTLVWSIGSWNDNLIAILRDTNSLWWRLTRQFLPWAFSVARLSHCAMGLKPFWGRSLIFIFEHGCLWWLLYSTLV